MSRESVPTTEQGWFELGYFDGARAKVEVSYHEVVHRYPEIPVADVPPYIQGTIDGIKGDSWRLQWVT